MLTETYKQALQLARILGLTHDKGYKIIRSGNMFRVLEVKGC